MSIKKVASIAGVSIATVSRFFNNPNQVSQQTREKVEAAIKRINYTPNALAQNLRRGKTGLIIAVTPKVSSPLYEAIISQLQQEAVKAGYQLLVKEAAFNQLPLSHYQHLLRCKQADGFVLLVGLPQEAAIEPESAIPVVLACEPNNSEQELPCIAINHTQAIFEATDYLVQQGHNNIAFIARNHEPMSVTLQQSGFHKAMRQHELSVFGRLLNKEQDKLPLKEKLQRLLNTQPRPTAIICADDDTAIETLFWAKALGLKVPEDLSLIGYSNIRYSELSDPPLTTVHQPMATIGNQAIGTLLDLIDGKPFTTTPTPINHQLIIRHSTTAIHQ